MDFTKSTIETLGNVITKPKLTERLLQKPPFRYLHDIIREVVTATGFGDGLYDENEISSAGAKGFGKDDKIDFLDKMVTAVSLSLNIQMVMKPAKAVAGLEPEKTNAFLTKLAEACTDDSIDRDSVVQRVLAGEKPSITRAASSDDRADEPSKAAPVSKPILKPQPALPPRPDRPSPTPSSESPVKPVVVEEEEEEEPQPDLPPLPPAVPSQKAPAPAAKISKPVPQPLQTLEDADRPVSGKKVPEIRPVSANTSGVARPAPPKLDQNVRTITPGKKLLPTDGKPGPKIISDGQSDDETDDEEDIMEADMGAIPELAGLDDLNTGVSMAALPPPSHTETVDAGGQHGKLVQNLLQAQQDLKGKDGGQTDEIILGMDRSSKSREAARKEIEKVKESLQALVKNANPLGRSMDYLHEDIESMQKEYEIWKAETGLHAQELSEAQRKTTASLEPLEQQLTSVQEKIIDEQAKIDVLKAALIKNDQKTQRLLRMRTEQKSAGGVSAI